MSDDFLPTPRLLLLEDARLATLADPSGTDGSSSSQSTRALSYGSMNPDERAEALDQHEMKLEWFHWEYLSLRRSTRTSRGVDIIQTIAENIVSYSTMSRSFRHTMTKLQQALELTIGLVRGSYDAFRVLHRLVQYEVAIIELDALPNASGTRREFSEATKKLAKVAWKAVIPGTCLYRDRLPVRSLPPFHRCCPLNTLVAQSNVRERYAVHFRVCSLTSHVLLRLVLVYSFVIVLFFEFGVRDPTLVGSDDNHVIYGIGILSKFVAGIRSFITSFLNEF